MISEKEALQKDIKKLEKDIELSVCLSKLKDNPDFKKLVLNGFLQEYVLDILYKQSQIDYIKLESAKVLNDYFDLIESNGELAKSNHAEYVKELNNY